MYGREDTISKLSEYLANRLMCCHQIVITIFTGNYDLKTDIFSLDPDFNFLVHPHPLERIIPPTGQYSKIESSLLVSSMFLGGAFGSVLGGSAADTFVVLGWLCVVLVIFSNAV